MDKIASHISRGSDPGNDPRIICCLPCCLLACVTQHHRWTCNDERQKGIKTKKIHEIPFNQNFLTAFFTPNKRTCRKSHERLKDEHVVYLSREITRDMITLPWIRKNSLTCLEDRTIDESRESLKSYYKNVMIATLLIDITGIVLIARLLSASKAGFLTASW
ncbi:hypothetical protein ALC53_11170 [Atta colombica]|uniref:Uncharacterized protein n=1 Tax=Atta colombica TaxID=520822 RepID=A0A195B2K6_9HYME|nr:hypothetical protein ALC53_11170 [Atta colombica]